MNKFLKLILVILFVFFAFGLVVFKIFEADFKSKIPTEIPSEFNYVPIGTTFKVKNTSQIVLIHFFNPKCPCSKFNLKHFESIVDKYKGKIEFKVYSTELTDMDFPLPIEYDENGKMAKLYGVYSTPQAVIIDAEGKLIYRGNYNKTRYCSNKKTEFVVMAIEQALHHNSISEIIQISGKPYGCSIFK